MLWYAEWIDATPWRPHASAEMTPMQRVGLRDTSSRLIALVLLVWGIKPKKEKKYGWIANKKERSQLVEKLRGSGNVCVFCGKILPLSMCAEEGVSCDVRNVKITTLFKLRVDIHKELSPCQFVIRNEISQFYAHLVISPSWRPFAITAVDAV